jgi:hypothetical protein
MTLPFRATFALVVVSFFCSLWAADSAPGAAEVAILLKDVPGFPLRGLVPGILRLDPKRARPLLFDEERQVFGALGVSSGGRVVAFAHDAFLSGTRFQAEPALLKMAANSIRWLGRSEAPAVGIDPGLAALEPLLQSQGFEVERIPPEELDRQVDVYCFAGQRVLPAPGPDRLRRFLLKGGGVFTVATPWAFADSFPDFHRLPANEIAMLAGIEFLPGGTASLAGEVVTRRPRPAEVLAAAREVAKPGTELRDGWIETLRGALWLDSADLKEVLPAIAVLDESIGPVIPTAAAPLVRDADPLRRAVVEIRSGLNRTLPAEMVSALPSAVDYPGPVPEKAPRVIRELELDGTWRGWLPGRDAGGWANGELRSTGLYAAPGEPIRVRVDPPLVGSGFEVVIGCYAGGLENRAEWRRYPRTQRAFPIAEPVTMAANGLGGLVYVRVPRGARLGTQKVVIEGATESPWFELGKTSSADWRGRIRNFPGPWAELAGKRIVLTVPSESIRRLEDPGVLMETWDEMLDRAAVLASIDRSGYRAERLIFDRQTSAGSLHSGYPVAAHFGPDLERALDFRKLKGEGSWGFFHEFGHNHQHDLWALPGTGETTCNLWSVYLFEEWTGRSRDGAHPDVHPLRRQQLRRAYFDGGRDFAGKWNVFTALDCYLLIQERFGWEPFRAVFAEYNRLPREEWPKSQQEKNDQWVLRLSKACGANLAPYYETWNLPLSESVADQLAGLSEWMPDQTRLR